MLRRIDPEIQWRCLEKGFWPTEAPAGSRTVIYGHNGSGKSTLSELLLSFAEGAGATGAAWEDEAGHRTRLRLAGTSPILSIAVFTRKWVDTNLSDFLDGDSASAIVTLGRAAIDAKGEEKRVAEEIETIRSEIADADKQRKSADLKVQKLARDVQDRLVSELKEFDYNFFTKNRFSISKVQDQLRKYKGDFPDANSHAEALKRLAEGAPSAVAPIRPAPAAISVELAEVAAILAETPTRVALAELEGSSTIQRWVEHGLELHQTRDHCLFCTAELTGARREQLARNFDESWLALRGKAKRLLSSFAQYRLALSGWVTSLPAEADLAEELRLVYGEALAKLQLDVAARTADLESIEDSLTAKADDPSATPTVAPSSTLATSLPVAVVAKAIDEHNETAARHDELAAQRKQAVLDHLFGSNAKAFRELEQTASDRLRRHATGVKAAELAARHLEEIRQAQFTTKDMADTLTRDLARVYGKAHLTVAVTADGKSYSCRRGSGPATDLSEGERTTLSLLYFLRKLEDEQTPTGDPTTRMVVIDDPSSSLDREALFATHQWLIDTLKIFGQYVILTHDFSLLRLFIKSHKTAWGASLKRIREGDADEKRFPKVSFLEMFGATVDGERTSKMGALPQMLVKSTTEYAYLFSMVMAGIADSENHERLFLLPNAARRVLEVFASYKAPHRTDFLQQLEVLVQADKSEPFRDVYDFCNRFSHGEGSESVDVLDARAVHAQIRRCMEFLRAVDPEHYERMCSATNVNPKTLN
jgi:wobble nucleotide-excising tRNase